MLLLLPKTATSSTTTSSSSSPSPSGTASWPQSQQPFWPEVCVCIPARTPLLYSTLRARSENLTPLTPPAISHQVDFSNRPAPHHQHSISQRRFDSSNSSLSLALLLLSAVAFPAEALAPSPYTSFLGLEEEGGDPLVRPSVRPPTTKDDYRMWRRTRRSREKEASIYCR